MVVFFNSLSNFSLNSILLSVILVGVAVPAAAHTYFFGFTELNINSKSKHIEVIHQFTAHDIENAIAEIKQVSFSPEHPQYDDFIKNYIEKRFVLEQNNHIVKMSWIGVEVKKGQLFAYQESFSESYLTNLLVKNTILVDTYVKQVNTVNYQDRSSANKIEGSLTFDQSVKMSIILPNE